MVRLRADNDLGNVGRLRCENSYANSSVMGLGEFINLIFRGAYRDACIDLNRICSVSVITSAKAIEDVVIISGRARLLTSPRNYLDRRQGRILERAIKRLAGRHHKVDASEVGVTRGGNLSKKATLCNVPGSFFVSLLNIAVEAFDYLGQDLLDDK